VIASLACYDLPPIRGAIEAWWAGLAKAMRAEGIEKPPDRLFWPEDCDRHWLEEKFLLTQTCGYPLMTVLKGRFEVVATPCYAAPGCNGPFYSSAFVLNADDPRDGLDAMKGARAAINGWRSHSGMNALRHAVAPLAGGAAYFSEVIVTGGHVLSCRAIAEGRADLAAIDAVTLALVATHDAEIFARLKVIGYSEPAPALPYVTSTPAGEDRLRRLREALYDAVADPDLTSAREALLLTGFSALPEGAYVAMLEMERQAMELGYGELA
jgi:ABC-type phosphate/phosphonate transport system substrate-binding protein